MGLFSSVTKEDVSRSYADLLGKDETVISENVGMVSSKISPSMGIQFGLFALFFKIYNTYVIATNKRLILALYSQNDFLRKDVISIKWDEIETASGIQRIASPYEVKLKTTEGKKYYLSIYLSSFDKNFEKENTKKLDALLKEKFKK